MFFRTQQLLTAGFVAALVSTTALAQTPPTPAAGTAAIVVGTVSAVSADGKSRLLSRGDGVFEGDHIITGGSSYARLGFADGGSMILRPRTDFLIERFRYTPGESPTAVKVVGDSATAATPGLQISNQGGSGGQAFFQLLRGGLRAVSGLVGKLNHDDYAVRSPVATIGIRGTEYIAVYCDAACAADPTVTASLPAGESASGGLVTGVSQGSIAVNSVTNAVASVGTGQFALTTAAGTQIILPGLPAFLAGEAWLAGSQAAAGGTGNASPAPAPAGALDATFSTAAAIGGVGAALAATAAAIAFNGDDNGNGSSPTTSTTTTSTTSTR